MSNYIQFACTVIILIVHITMSIYCYGVLQHFFIFKTNKQRLSYTITDRLMLLLISILGPVVGIVVFKTMLHDYDYEPGHDFSIMSKIYDKIDYQEIDLSQVDDVWKCEIYCDESHSCETRLNRCISCIMIKYLEEV